MKNVYNVNLSKVTKVKITKENVTLCVSVFELILFTCKSKSQHKINTALLIRSKLNNAYTIIESPQNTGMN